MQKGAASFLLLWSYGLHAMLWKAFAQAEKAIVLVLNVYMKLLDTFPLLPVMQVTGGSAGAPVGRLPVQFFRPALIQSLIGEMLCPFVTPQLFSIAILHDHIANTPPDVSPTLWLVKAGRGWEIVPLHAHAPPQLGRPRPRTDHLRPPLPLWELLCCSQSPIGGRLTGVIPWQPYDRAVSLLVLLIILHEPLGTQHCEPHPTPGQGCAFEVS